MAATGEILCIGSVLWDIIGRSASHMRRGSDVPGRITRLPGGVAMNIAMTLHRFGLTPQLLTVIGMDDEGHDLAKAAHALGVGTTFAYKSDDLPTDRYMAVEGANGLIAAIADAHSLEAAGDKVLAPLVDGRLGSANAPYPGLIAIDGNLTEALLAEIAESPAFAAADLRVVPASPGKAERLRPLIGHQRATFYVNREEAGVICHEEFADAAAAAQALHALGAPRALVTDGSNAAAQCDRTGVMTASPPDVLATRVTGAGDTFIAAHIAREVRGADRADALAGALRAAALYVSGETGHD